MTRAGTTVRRVDYARGGARVTAYRLVPQTVRGRLVVAHATGNDALYPHASLVSAALALGHEAFLFDLDGHGRLSSTVLREADAPSMIDDALAAAARDAPPLRTVLLGQSLGASLALAAAARPTFAGADAVVAISAPTALTLTPAAGLSELRTLATKEFWSLVHDYGVPGAMPALGPFRRGAFPVRLDTGGQTAFRYPAFVDRLVRGLSLVNAAPGVACPVLLVYGGRDKIVPVEQGRILAARLPRARLVEVPGATHFTTPLSAFAHRQILDFLGTEA